MNHGWLPLRESERIELGLDACVGGVEVWRIELFGHGVALMMRTHQRRSEG